LKRPGSVTAAGRVEEKNSLRFIEKLVVPARAGVGY